MNRYGISGGLAATTLTSGLMRSGGKGTPRLLSQAYWWSPRYATDQALVGQGLAAGIDAQFGSTAGADANDPLLLSSPEPALYMTAGAGNQIRVLNEAALQITGDLDMRIDCSLISWSGSLGEVPLISKYGGGGLRSYMFALATNGTMRLYLSGDGTNVTSAAGPAPTVVAGERIQLRVTWRQSDKRVQFFQWLNGVWTQIGADGVINIASIHSNAQPVFIGGTTFQGYHYSAEIFASITGANQRLRVVFNDPARYNATLENLTAVTGQNVDILRPSSGRKNVLVERPTLLFGLDDSLISPNHAVFNFAAGQDFTIVYVLRTFSPTPLATGAIFAKRQSFGSTGGFLLYNTAETAGLRFGLGSSIADSPVLSVGGLAIMGARKNVGGVSLALNGVSGATVAVANYAVDATPPTDGKLAGSGTNYTDYEFFGKAIFLRYLSDEELVAAGEELLRG